MTYQNFIERYRKLLLEIIPDFYKEEGIINFTFKRPDDGKNYFAGPKPSVDIKYRVEIYSGRRITDEEFSALKEPCFKQHKKWRKKYSTFVNKMKDILPYIDHPNLPLFRLRLFKLNHKYKYLEDVLDDKTPLSIFICFVSYLVSLRKMGKDANTAETIIRNKMIDQEDEYIQKNKDRIEKVLGGKVKKKSAVRISDNKFKQLCNEVERECPRKLTDERIFFKELSKMSKSNKYDQTGKGYTPLTAKRRYYEVFPSKKANQ